ncbi:hypothetical protein NQU36_27730, partial [Escherichia coli]|uniref:hypothetical protein n=1 Tax=Escherichia coli TaxID=562 RepID=UPI00211887CC
AIGIDLGKFHPSSCDVQHVAHPTVAAALFISFISRSLLTFVYHRHHLLLRYVETTECLRALS